MSRRAFLRIGFLGAIGALCLFLMYSQSSWRPQLNLVVNTARQNRKPLNYDENVNKANGQPAVLSVPMKKTEKRVETVVKFVGQQPEGIRPTRIPDLVKLNMDDMSKPRQVKDGNEDLGQYSALNQLIPNLVPSIVHFVWCGRRWFEFKPYLSILSTIRAVKPDKLILHYEAKPMHDKLYYHQWFQDLQHDFSFFESEQMTLDQLQICYGSRDQQMQLILELLQYEGGIYVGENTWMLDFPASNRQIDLDVSLSPNSLDGFVIMRAGLVKENNISLDELATRISRNNKNRVRRQECATTTQLYNGLQNPHCLIVKGGLFDHFYPSDIWDLQDAFGKVARKIFYGTDIIMKPEPNYDTLVPNIGHMIWIGGKPMDFVFYLSVLSMLYVLKVDTIYLHGDVPPTGPYWYKLNHNPQVAPRLKFITRPQPLLVYQGIIEPYFKALMSDIIRVDIMIKYGGIYADTDAIWVKPLTKEDRGYDAVASYDWVDWSFPFPDSVNFGLSYGKPNAPFWRLFKDSMRVLHNDIHGYTGVMKPYKILEKYPHLLRIDRHLQVICYQYRCHPTWVRNYHNMSIDHVTTGSLKNWRRSVNAFHWTHPNPPELINETTLAAGKGVFADLGRMVLSKAGLL